MWLGEYRATVIADELARPVEADTIHGMYVWVCPSCGARLRLRQKVTLRKRRCPECGQVVERHQIGVDVSKEALGLVALVVFAVFAYSLRGCH